MTKTLRLNLPEINESLLDVEKNWQSIDDRLEELRIGRKDTPFNSDLREKMMYGYEYLDSLLYKNVEPFSKESISQMLELNHCVHYGKNTRLRMEYSSSLRASSDKFYANIGVLQKWYRKHKKSDDTPMKIAAEIYVGIIGYPQLFIEGNHRAGSMIASWINIYNGQPPFILSAESAIAYFAPSSEIKHFSDKSTWRGRMKLPKYNKCFRTFMEKYADKKYLMKN